MPSNFRDDARGPIIRWDNYGYEGWKPKSYDTLKDALLDQRYSSDFVFTKFIDFETIDRDD